MQIGEKFHAHTRIRHSIVVSISPCHGDDRGSIPRVGMSFSKMITILFFLYALNTGFILNSRYTLQAVLFLDEMVDYYINHTL